MPSESRRRLRQPPTGLLLGLAGIVSVLWLAVTGQLALYIHPRYFAFTTVTAGLALIATVAAYAWLPPAGHDDHDHHHPGGWRRRLGVAGRSAAGVGLVIALLVLPPTTLSSSTVQQRDLNAGVDTDTVTLIGADPSGFALRDWAALLADPATAAAYAGREATLSGFVTPSPDGDPDVLYLARFVVTCCTVDAQPVGLPVAVPGWAEAYPVDGWLEVTGTFAATGSDGAARVVLKPSALTPIDQPAQPYDF